MDAARRRADCATVLLRARDPVRKTIVSSEVIDLRRRLVVPRAPGTGPVPANDCTLVARDDHSFWIVGIDPELMIVVAAGRAFDRRPRFAGVGRTIHRRIHHIDHVGVLRIDTDLFEIPAPVPETLVTR